MKGIKTKDVPKMKIAIDLQYLAIRLRGISAAADAIDYLDPRVILIFTIRYGSDTDAVEEILARQSHDRFCGQLGGYIY